MAHDDIASWGKPLPPEQEEQPEVDEAGEQALRRDLRRLAVLRELVGSGRATEDETREFHLGVSGLLLAIYGAD